MRRITCESRDSGCTLNPVYQPVACRVGGRYGLVGRNGTGKTTLLRALSLHQIKGIPVTTQILHVEQEVVGDDTTVLQAVLACDSERSALLTVRMTPLRSADCATYGRNCRDTRVVA